MKYLILFLALVGCGADNLSRAKVTLQATDHQFLLEQCNSDAKISHMKGVADAAVTADFEKCLKAADLAAGGSTDAGVK